MISSLNRAGPGVFGKPLRVFGDAEHRRFWHACSYIFSANVKISELGRSRSGHQVTWSDLTSEKGWIFAITTRTDRFLCNFQRLIWVAVSLKRLSPDFDIGDLRSGQFCDLSVFSQWEKIERRYLWNNVPTILMVPTSPNTYACRVLI